METTPTTTTPTIYQGSIADQTAARIEREIGTKVRIDGCFYTMVCGEWREAKTVTLTLRRDAQGLFVTRLGERKSVRAEAFLSRSGERVLFLTFTIG